MIRIKHLGAKNSCTADAHYNLGLLFRLQDQDKDALQHLNYALTIREVVAGKDALEVGDTHMSIGKLFEDKVREKYTFTSRLVCSHLLLLACFVAG